MSKRSKRRQGPQAAGREVPDAAGREVPDAAGPASAPSDAASGASGKARQANRAASRGRSGESGQASRGGSRGRSGESRQASRGGSRGRPAAAARRQSAPGWPLGVQIAFLAAVFAVVVMVAELAGAANLGVALGVGQIVFAIAVVYLLVRR